MLYRLARYGWMLLQWIELIVLTLPMYLLARLPGDWTRNFYPKLFRLWSQVFVHALGVDLRLHQKNIDALPPVFIMIANHPSAFEDIGIPALFDVASLAKEEVRYWWISGKISEAAGTLFVKRECRDSRNAAKQQIIDALRQGRSVALYPEGGCKGKRLFSSFRFGAFDISLQTGIPIVPVYIHYESQNDFAWPDGVSVVEKMLDFMRSQNPRANYYLYDAFDPGAFDDVEDYTRHAHDKYLEWQRRYLD